MKILSGKSKFLISLNPAHYLFAVASDIDFTNVFDVARNWSIDCQIGVFDETEKVMFVFDPEFGLIYYSFDSACAPSNFDDFSSFFNTEVKSTFVSQGKERTGADKDRIRNYFDTVIAPAI